jgi:hypothetical protein
MIKKENAMSDLRSNLYESGDFDRPTHASHAFLLNQAINQFNQARWDGLLEKVKSALLRRAHALLDLETLSQNQVRAQRYGGIQPVSLDRICGTLGRTGDFDSRFHPLENRLRDRWVSIAIARSQNAPLEAVALIQVGDCYFVKDGHHRISVARARGEAAIDAEIIVWEVTGNLPWEKQASPGLLPQTA